MQSRVSYSGGKIINACEAMFPPPPPLDLGVYIPLGQLRSPSGGPKTFGCELPGATCSIKLLVGENDCMSLFV